MSEQFPNPIVAPIEADVMEALLAGIAPASWTVLIDEGQRQLVLLALHRLRLERPGFDYALGEIEQKLGGQLAWPPDPDAVALAAVRQERITQDRRWGPDRDDRKSAFDWFQLVWRYGADSVFRETGTGEYLEFRRCMVQVAAVAVAAVNSWDRTHPAPDPAAVVAEKNLVK